MIGFDSEASRMRSARSYGNVKSVKESHDECPNTYHRKGTDAVQPRLATPASPAIPHSKSTYFDKYQPYQLDPALTPSLRSSRSKSDRNLRKPRTRDKDRAAQSTSIGPPQPDPKSSIDTQQHVDLPNKGDDSYVQASGPVQPVSDRPTVSIPASQQPRSAPSVEAWRRMAAQRQPSFQASSAAPMSRHKSQHDLGRGKISDRAMEIGLPRGGAATAAPPAEIPRHVSLGSSHTAPRMCQDRLPSSSSINAISSSLQPADSGVDRQTRTSHSARQLTDVHPAGQLDAPLVTASGGIKPRRTTEWSANSLTLDSNAEDLRQKNSGPSHRAHQTAEDLIRTDRKAIRVALSKMALPADEPELRAEKDERKAARSRPGLAPQKTLRLDSDDTSLQRNASVDCKSLSNVQSPELDLGIPDLKLANAYQLQPPDTPEQFTSQLQAIHIDDEEYNSDESLDSVTREVQRTLQGSESKHLAPSRSSTTNSARVPRLAHATSFPSRPTQVLISGSHSIEGSHLSQSSSVLRSDKSAGGRNHQTASDKQKPMPSPAVPRLRERSVSLKQTSAAKTSTEIASRRMDPTEAFVRSPRLTRIFVLARGHNAGLRVSVADVGAPSGHPVVVYLGLGAVRYLIGLYDEVAALLGLRLICIDRWGMGRTDDVPSERRGLLQWSSVVTEVMDALHVGRFSILAHSAGAPYAMATAVLESERVAGPIYLLAPWVSADMESGYKWLRYIPEQVIRTAQAAEWRMASWKYGRDDGNGVAKPPSPWHEESAGLPSSAASSLYDPVENKTTPVALPSPITGRVEAYDRPSTPPKGLKASFLGGLSGLASPILSAKRRSASTMKVERREPLASSLKRRASTKDLLDVAKTATEATDYRSLDGWSFLDVDSGVLAWDEHLSNNSKRTSSMRRSSGDSARTSQQAARDVRPSQQPREAARRTAGKDSGSMSKLHHDDGTRAAQNTVDSVSLGSEHKLHSSDLGLALLRASHAESLRSGSTADLTSILGGRSSRPWGFNYKDVHKPIRIWHGERDERIGLAGTLWMERECLQCTVKIVKGANHSLMTNTPVILEVLER